MSLTHKGNTQPSIDQEEHTHIGGVAGKKVFVVDSVGNIIDFPGDSNWAINVQVDSGDTNIEYVGRANIGSATSDAVWQIMKVNDNTGTVVTWADGNENFDNVFDNREALSYS